MQALKIVCLCVQLDDAAEEVSPTVKGIISFAALERSRMPHNPPYETPKKLHFAREIGSGKTSTAVHPKQQKAVSDAKSATYIDKPGLAISRVQAQVDRAQARHSKEEVSAHHWFVYAVCFVRAGFRSCFSFPNSTFQTTNVIYIGT